MRLVALATLAGFGAGACGGGSGDQADAAATVDAAPSTCSDAGPAPDADPGTPTHDEVLAWVEAYKAAHPGNGGKDWDINAKSDAELAADPDAARLVALCGPDQRPVIPLLAWEYGGGDHPWIDPAASALAYCVYIPVNPSTAHWSYDGDADRVTADTYVLFPENNPCNDEVGRDQVAACIGDDSNFEILVDTVSRNDGHDVGLELSEASTELRLLIDGCDPVFLILNL